MLGYGRYGCVISPPLACQNKHTENITQKVGKLFSSQHSQRSWDKNFRTQYPLLENTEFETYQREFPTEWEKAEEIRRRIPDADNLFVLPTDSCPIPNKTSENYQECLTKVSENLNTQLLLPVAEGNLRELLESEGKEPMVDALKHVRESIQTLHWNRIVHNDISLENILWGYADNGSLWCKLADFGIALFFPTRDDETLTERIEESARSSLSSNYSIGSISPVPRTSTPTRFTLPLPIGTKKGIVPDLALGFLKSSPRNITVDSEFESMKERDISAFNGVLQMLRI